MGFVLSFLCAKIVISCKLLVSLPALMHIIMKHLAPLLLVALLSSCNPMKRADNLIDRAEAIVFGNPDSALVILQAIHEPEALTDSVRAKYWLVIGQAHYYCDRSTAEDSLLKYALDYYKEHPDTKRTTQAYKLFAQHLWWKGKRAEATRTLLEGMDVARSAHDTAGSRQLLFSAAFQNLGDENFEDAVKYLKELLATGGNEPDSCTTFNMLGIAYFYLEQKDSSLLYLQKAHDAATRLNYNLEARGLISRNYADILSDFGEHQRAIRVQRDVLRSYTEAGNKDVSASYSSLGRYYLNLQQMDSARYYMQKGAETRPPYADQDLSVSNYELVQNTLMDYISTRRFRIKDVTLFSNRMFENFLNRRKEIDEKNESRRVLQQRNLYLAATKQQERMVFVIVLLSALLAGVLAAFYIQRRKKLLQEKEEELDTLRHLWDDAKKTNTENDLFFKKILLQQMGLIRMMATNPTPANQEILSQVTRITNREMPTDELLNWEDLYKVVDSIYGHFYTHILTRFGGLLNERELQLCCLLKANFSTKEISVVTRQSVRTIYQRKTTIRQKLGMDEKEDIADFMSR